MIYLFVFIYLLYLSIYYDILEKKKCKWTHFKIAVSLLILVAGLRWRVGSDTVLYAQDFIQCHDLFHLEIADFESFDKMPFWVILNAVCKTIWNNYLLVQLVTCTIHISLIGIFIKKVVPSLCFTMLLFYCFFEYTAWNMEASRHSLAVSFFLTSLLYLNDNKIIVFILFVVLSFLSHVFSGVVILIFLIYYTFVRSETISYMIILFVVFVVINDINFFSNLLELFFREAYSGAGYKVYNYAVSDNELLGTKDYNFLFVLKSILFPIFSFFVLKIVSSYYCKLVFLNKKIFDVAIYLFVLFQICKFSFGMFFRVADYFAIIYQILFILFVIYIVQKIVPKQRVLVYFVLILIPLFQAGYRYWGKAPTGVDNFRRYYPYSSIFNRKIDYEREIDHQIRGGGYSKDNDY